jgi:hypothetical protein
MFDPLSPQTLGHSQPAALAQPVVLTLAYAVQVCSMPVSLRQSEVLPKATL